MMNSKELIHIIKRRILLLLITALVPFSTGLPVGYNPDTLKVEEYLIKARELFSDNYEKAYEYALEGLRHASPEVHPVERIGLLQIAAEIEYFYLNNSFGSISHLNEMRALSDETGYKHGIPWFNLNLGNIYYYQNNFERALGLYEEAMRGAMGPGDSVIYINAMTGKADILRQKGDYDSAMILINKGVDYASRHNRKEMLLFLLDDIADIYKRRGILDSSIYHYRRIKDIAEDVNSIYWKNVTELNLEYVRYLRDNSYNPVQKLKSLQEESMERNFIRQYIDAGITLSEIYASRGQFREAYDQMIRIVEVKDSIASNESVRKAAELESQYYIQKAEMENLNLMKQNEIASMKLKNRKTVLWLIIFALTLALFLIYLILRKYYIIRDNLKKIRVQEEKIYEQNREIVRKEKEIMKQKLLARERELAGKLMKAYHTDRLLKKIIEEINSIRETLKPDGDQKSEEVRLMLQSMTNRISMASGEQLWSEFEQSFVNINPGFTERLSARHPDLTPNETRLCIFLYLNLRTKEISSITQQSIKSINVGRTRLRKKLE